MIEVKLVSLVTALNRKVKTLALSSLNRRSVRAINKYTKQEEYIANGHAFLDSMEDQIEKEYQEKDAAINAAYKQVSSM